jgi:hypothetical protein
MQVDNFLSSRRARTIFECTGEHDSELSFAAGQIITNGKRTLDCAHMANCIRVVKNFLTEACLSMI